MEGEKARDLEGWNWRVQRMGPGARVPEGSEVEKWIWLDGLQGGYRVVG